MRRTVSAALIATLTLSVFASGPASATDTGAVTQVTDGNNKSTVPVISASGDEVVFHSSATDLPDATQTNGGIDDIYVADTSGSPFTFAAYSDGDSGERASFPDISANGRWIVFTRVPDGGSISEVVRIDLTDDSEVTISGNANSGTADNVPGARVDNGGNVVFASLATDLTGSADADAADGLSDVYWWTGTGNATKISNDVDNTAFVNPDISATGGFIAYNSDDGATTKDIFTNDSTGGTEANLTAAGDGQHDLPKLSDDGSSVSFRSDSTNLDGGNNAFNVFVHNAGTIDRITNHAVAVTSPTISGDGVYVAYQTDGEVHRSAVADGTTIQVSDHGGSSIYIDYPSISGDGSRIAFAQSLDATAAGVQVHLWEENAVPDTPAAPTAAATSDTTAEVTFAAVDGNGSAVTEYTVTASPGGATGTGSGSPVTVSGLEASTAYTFTVVATNANGDSQPSPASNEITTDAAPGAPDAPTAVTATATGDTSAEVTFTAPDDNGSGITGYTVTASPGGVQATGGASPITVNGLTEGETYTFTVQATNGAGTGPASAASAPITLGDACGPILSQTYQGMSGTDGRIARLYAAYFLRSPDTGGFQFWQARIAAGDWTNDNAATFFSESAEFEALYGANLSNDAFIDLLYENVLCRAPDAGGKAFWLDRMTNQGWTRGQIALGFSDSAEFKARTLTS